MIKKWATIFSILGLVAAAGTLSACSDPPPDGANVCDPFCFGF